MRRVPATEFITKIGQYMEAAQRSPLAVTSHGREKLIVMSPEQYRKLRGDRSHEGMTEVSETPVSRAETALYGHNPMAAALSVINTSTPVKIQAEDLKRLFKSNASRLKPQARLLIEEVPSRTLAGLVKDKAVTWSRLYRLAEWVDTRDDKKKVFLRDMAGLGLGDTP